MYGMKQMEPSVSDNKKQKQVRFQVLTSLDFNIVYYSFTNMIRVQTKEDHQIVQALTRQAFWNLYQPGANEHFLLHNLRKSKDFIPELSLVLEEEGQIVAHITYSHSKVTYSNKVLPTITFGPVSVSPSKQLKGYGGKLIKYSIQKAKEMGFKAIIILGYPYYYERFGFRCTAQANICLGDLIFYKACMFLQLQEGYLTSNKELGVFKESDQFNVNSEEVQEFDKKFPPKEKFETLSQKQFQIISRLQSAEQLPPNSKDCYNREKIA